MAHDVCETPAIGTKSASQERFWLWKAEILRQSVLFLLKIRAKEEKTAKSLIIPYFLSAELRKIHIVSEAAKTFGKSQLATNEVT